MSRTKPKVLLVDDDAAVRTVLAALLGQAGIATAEAAGAAEALGLLQAGAIDVMVTDVRMPGMDGIALLERSLETWPDVPVIVLTAHGTVPLAVEATRKGAFEFLLKPFEREEVLALVERALLVARGGSEPPPQPFDSRLLIGDSPCMRELRDAMRRAASSTSTVLVRGENGTGKELVARAIHDASPRRDGPFVKLNCAAVPESLLESELFGYEKGAFTGANKQKPGRVELADRGTLLLDEIGDYSPAVQLKLLRILQEREVSRLGGTDTFKVDVRFIAATNRSLESLVQRGAFREDLFYRLSVLPIDVPPLRERPDDVQSLALHFAARSAAANGRAGLRLEDAAIELLAAQAWPGNVRQLENFVERLVVFCDGSVVARAGVERELARDAARAPEPRELAREGAGGLAAARRSAERDEIQRALAISGNNRSQAARLLKMSRRTLYNKLEELGLA